MDASFWRIVIWASWGGAHGLLNSLFETVLMVADERSLMETIVTFKPDLVIVDLSLPGGREVNIARPLMQRHPDLRLIVLSVHDESTVVTQIRLQGDGAFVFKRIVHNNPVPAVHE